MKLHKTIKILLILLIFVDLGYSFKQHYSKNLDGDMAWNVIPAEDVKPILQRPFGVKAIVNNETYVNPNRFFCHWFFREYLLNVPIALQQVSTPINSVYLSCAIAKILTQAFLILLLSVLISGSRRLMSNEFIISAFIITCLFQTNGFERYMGIIDSSTTYLFFYGFPALLLLFYIKPFLFQLFHRVEINNRFRKYLIIPFALVICLSGPLNPGIILVFSLILFGNIFIKNWRNSDKNGIEKITNTISKIPRQYWFYMLPIAVLSLYSLFLGKYNSLTLESQIPLLEMYGKLPEGIIATFFTKLGYPVLFIFITLNLIFISKKLKSEEGRKIVRVFYWVLLFSMVYILLLPLGGYREYRPFVIRYDTILPITLCFFFIYGVSTLYILKNSSVKTKWWYVPLLIGFIFFFTKADNENFDRNECERKSIAMIKASEEQIVKVDTDCCIINWEPIYAPEKSELISALMLHWNLIDEKKLFYNGIKYEEK